MCLNIPVSIKSISHICDVIIIYDDVIIMM